MKLTARMLKRIINEELARSQRARRSRLTEGTKGNPVKITPEYINRIIREEYSAFKKQERLAEARRRLRAKRLAESRRRRLADQRRRRASKDTVYYY